MITIVLPTANRAEMLRTALRSVASQNAREKIALVIVSENGGTHGSSEVCAEFPDLPIRYIFREPAIDAKAHGAALFAEAATLRSPYVAVLHDDDWWGTNHLGNGLGHLEANKDAVAYWSTSLVVDGESSWFIRCWNISCWMAAGFPAVNEVAKLDTRQAALACLGSAPAHYSTLIAKKDALAEAFLRVSVSGNLLDNDRLLFFELSKNGQTLVNFMPEAFIRQHLAQEGAAFSRSTYRKHTGITTRAILQFCKDDGMEVVRKYAELVEECPRPEYLPWLKTEITDGVMEELRRHDPTSAARIMRKYRSAKWFVRELCPPLLWEAARQMKTAVSRARLRQLAHTATGRN